MPGQERVGPPGDADRNREEHRIDGLRHEQVGDPFDVGDHPAALGDDPRHRCELAVEQHELGDRAGRRGTVPHRDADVGVLERERVVDTIACHRDGVAARLQPLDDPPLLLRTHPSENRMGLDGLGELLVVVGELTRIDDSVGAGQTDARGDGADGSRDCRRRSP